MTGYSPALVGQSSFSEPTMAQSGEAWRRAVLAEDAIIKDAIQNLTETALKAAVVVARDGKLLGTVTDGDIRRGLLRGLDIGSPVLSVIKRDPLVVPADVSRDTVVRLMQANDFGAIPVVDADRRVVGLHLLHDLLVPPTLTNRMVIMAGGKGTRLRPHSENCPKPLLPVGGKPILEHIIERAKSEGFHRFTLTLNYLGHMIEDYFGDGSKWEIEIDYVRENEPLGTAGALGLLASRPDAPFVVSNGDVLTDIHYNELLEFHCRQKAMATMAVRLHEWQHPYGVVRTQGVDIIGFDEKPISRSHINAGVYALDPAALDGVAAHEHCDMPSLFSRLKESGARTIVYPMHEPWLDIGRIDDLERAHAKHSQEKDG